MNGVASRYILALHHLHHLLRVVLFCISVKLIYQFLCLIYGFLFFTCLGKVFKKEMNYNKEGDSEKEKCYGELVTVERDRNAGTLDFELGFVGQNNTDLNFISCYYRLFSKSQFSGI